jgi:hypothetical protein
MKVALAWPAWPARASFPVMASPNPATATRKMNSADTLVRDIGGDILKWRADLMSGSDGLIMDAWLRGLGAKTEWISLLESSVGRGR